ncbi:next to BRCA1 gene 1 protein isoform X2 [Ornithorhynchus anatinus]|uniref:Next to BRCA1 gene 1 protein n=1 Tax=Ornithorhynchus anatinus TaxID=9258 RepID=F7AVM5_ORNAN|nr:next to BRCA1 gene 1 protein isoform X2 [Ornithorhynchus anatinus]
MEPQVNLRVTFRNETQSFLVSDSSHTTWADVEAMVRVSFDLDAVQIKYLDEDCEEVSVNSQGEYEESLKIAVHQGNQLQMNVYEKQRAAGALAGARRPGDQAAPCPGRKPLGHYSTLARALDPGRRRREEAVEAAEEEEEPEEEKGRQKPGAEAGLLAGTSARPQERPPDWFTSYLEEFREQVVKETVEKLSEKLSLQSLPARPRSVPEEAPSPLPGRPCPWAFPGPRAIPCHWGIPCSGCGASLVGVRYQCSLCPSYNICELCEAGPYGHDPNHVLLKLRRPPSRGAGGPSPTSLPHLLVPPEPPRPPKATDRSSRKAEKRRLRAEKKQREAEVKELRKQLKLHRKIHLWSSGSGLPGPGALLTKMDYLPPAGPILVPLQPCPAVGPTLSAVFVDENLPDGTHLQPGTKFVKHWRMENTGSVQWSADTKLTLLWGNLRLAGSDLKEVAVPCLRSGHVGIVSVEFIAPGLEGTYTSHWRLAHRGQQFGPRVWCSVIVDPRQPEEAVGPVGCGQGSGRAGRPADAASPRGTSDRELYIPSVDLLTAQDLLSFELLDINIVQELERVPHNTPEDTTPCLSPLPHGSLAVGQPGQGQALEASGGAALSARPEPEESQEGPGSPPPLEEVEEDLSGSQFVCETVIRSLTLDAAPDHSPPLRSRPLATSLQLLPEGIDPDIQREDDACTASRPPVEMGERDALPAEGPHGEDGAGDELEEEEEEGDDEEDLMEVGSQGSSDSTDDYIIILPECFDTSRPLGKSAGVSGASPQAGPTQEAAGPAREAAGPTREAAAPTLETAGPWETSSSSSSLPPCPGVESQLQEPSIGDGSARLGPLGPESSLAPPRSPPRSPTARVDAVSDHSSDADANTTADVATSTLRGEEHGGTDSHDPGEAWQVHPDHLRTQPERSLAGGLVKGALSVAASAYKALFAGLPLPVQPPVSEEQTAVLLAHLFEMGFCDRQLNLRLLRRHNYRLAPAVTDLLQASHNDWAAQRF